MRQGNFFGTNKKSTTTSSSVLKPPSKSGILKPPPSKPGILKPPPSKPSILKPPPTQKVSKPVQEKIKKKLRRDVNVANIIPQNFEKSKYSKEDIIELFKLIDDIEKIEELKEKVEEFIDNDNDNSYISEILMYIIETFSLVEIKFIISLFLKTEIKTLGLFFEKFLKNKEDIINVAKFTKFSNNLSNEDPEYKKSYQDKKMPIFQKIKEGQVYRIITPVFLHGSLLHILFNMIWLFLLMKLIEMKLGVFKTFKNS
jgi:hypothetical protein